MRQCFLAVLILPLALAACASSVRVTADWDPKSDLSARTTFALASPDHDASTGRSAELQSDLFNDRVRRALLLELPVCGRMPATDPSKAQFRVFWHAQSETRYETDTVAYRNRVWHDDPWRANYYETNTYSYEVQTLTLFLREPTNGSVLWRASAEAREVPEASPEDREARIREMVRRMLEKLPAVPKPGQVAR